MVQRTDGPRFHCPQLCIGRCVPCIPVASIPVRVLLHPCWSSRFVAVMGSVTSNGVISPGCNHEQCYSPHGFPFPLPFQFGCPAPRPLFGVLGPSCSCPVPRALCFAVVLRLCFLFVARAPGVPWDLPFIIAKRGGRGPRALLFGGTRSVLRTVLFTMG